MANSNLETALKTAGLTAEQFADIIQVDPKSVQRWLDGNTTPYPRHRQKIARALEIPEHQLWPDTATPPTNAESDRGGNVEAELAAAVAREPEQPAAKDAETATVEDEVTGTWPRLNDPKAPHPATLLAAARRQIDIFDGRGDSLLIPSIRDALTDSARHGCQVRVVTAKPPQQIEALIGQPQIELRLAPRPAGASVFRADDTLLLPIPLDDRDHPALLRLQRLSNGGLFDRLLSHVQAKWDAATPITNPSQLVQIPGYEEPAANQPAPEAARRRWPGKDS